MVPQQKRLHSDFEWLLKHMHKLQKTLAGKFIAVVNKRVTSGNSAVEAYEKSQKKFPGFEPLMDIVPSKECLLL